MISHDFELFPPLQNLIDVESKCGQGMPSFRWWRHSRHHCDSDVAVVMCKSALTTKYVCYVVLLFTPTKM